MNVQLLGPTIRLNGVFIVVEYRIANWSSVQSQFSQLDYTDGWKFKYAIADRFDSTEAPTDIRIASDGVCTIDYEFDGMLHRTDILHQLLKGREHQVARYSKAVLECDAVTAAREAVWLWRSMVDVRDSFLGLRLQGSTLYRRNTYVDFARKIQPLKLVRVLLEAGEQGLTLKELNEEIYADRAVTPNALDQLKIVANEVIAHLGIEVSADGRGIWRLIELSNC